MYYDRTAGKYFFKDEKDLGQLGLEAHKIF